MVPFVVVAVLPFVVVAAVLPFVVVAVVTFVVVAAAVAAVLVAAELLAPILGPAHCVNRVRSMYHFLVWRCNTEKKKAN